MFNFLILCIMLLKKVKTWYSLTYAYMQRRRRFRRGSSGSHSTLSLLRKELREGNLQALLGGSSYTIPPTNAAADPFLSSLIYTLPMADSSRDIQPESLEEECLVDKSSDVKVVERYENGHFLVKYFCNLTLVEYKMGTL